MATALEPRRLGILVLSAITDDPRVRRQGDLFSKAGWDVVGFGLAGGRSPAPDWHIVSHDGSRRASMRAGTNESGSEGHAGEARNRAHQEIERLKHRARHAARLVLARIAPSRLASMYWDLNPHFTSIYELAKHHQRDLWLANDWTMLPIAERLATEQGTPFLYDTHELASNEYPERLRWRLLWQPIVKAIEGDMIRRASLISCVSPGIAEELKKTYGLAELPLTIRNAPAYEATPFRATGDIVHVLYHGLVAPGRGLEACIRSVHDWRPEFHLTIRGPVTADYERDLKAEIAACGVTSRVTLAPPVATIDLVREAARFDVGLFALPDHSLHNRFALPNKFFEYVMAGLALCVSDLPEMRRLIDEYRLGVAIAAVDPAAIAAGVNSLDRHRIDGFKRNSLGAARKLNWQADGACLERAARSILERSRGNASATLVSS